MDIQLILLYIVSNETRLKGQQSFILFFSSANVIEDKSKWISKWVEIYIRVTRAHCVTLRNLILTSYRNMNCADTMECHCTQDIQLFIILFYKEKGSLVTYGNLLNNHKTRVNEWVRQNEGNARVGNWAAGFVWEKFCWIFWRLF